MFPFGQTYPQHKVSSSSFFIRDILGTDVRTNSGPTHVAKYYPGLDQAVTPTQAGLLGPTGMVPSPYQANLLAAVHRGFPLDGLLELRDAMTVPIPLPVYMRSRSPGDAEVMMKPRKCRRSRTVFTDLQLMGLEKRFDGQKYLSTSERLDLADSLGLSQVQVMQKDGSKVPTKPKGRPRKDDSELECCHAEQELGYSRHDHVTANPPMDVVHVPNNQSEPTEQCDRRTRLYNPLSGN